MAKRKYKIYYTEKLIKTSIVNAEGEADAQYKFDNNEDEERETISSIRSIRTIDQIRYEGRK